MHKIVSNVHILSFLCNNYLAISSICTIFELKLEARLHLGNKRKMPFFFVFLSIFTIFAADNKNLDDV